MPTARLAWSPQEAAGTAGVPYRTVLAEIHSGKLRAVRIGKHYRIADSELRRWIGETEEGSPEAAASDTRRTA